MIKTRETLASQYQKAEALYKNRCEEFIEEHYKGSTRPSMIYHCWSYKEIGESEVYAISIYHPKKPWAPKRITKAFLDEFFKFMLEVELSTDQIRIHLIQKLESGTSTSSVKLSDIDGKCYAYSRDELVPYQNQLKEKFEPRPGRIPCTYCRKQIPEETAVDYTVIARQYPNMRKTAKYCPGNCGPYDQMAHEG